MAQVQNLAKYEEFSKKYIQRGVILSRMQVNNEQQLSK
jgi:hypothetical protein